MDEDTAQTLIEPMFSNIISMDRANALLVSSLVKYLAEKGLIDLDKYLESNKKTEELIKNATLQRGVSPDVSEDDLQRNVDFVNHVFSMHREDFTKPE